MFCTACGRQLQEDDRFCGHCGRAVSQAPVETEGASEQNRAGGSAEAAPVVPAFVRTIRSTAEMHMPLRGASAPMPEPETEPVAPGGAPPQSPAASAPPPPAPVRSESMVTDTPPAVPSEPPVTSAPPVVPLDRFKPTYSLFEVPQQRARLSQPVVLLGILMMAGAIIALLILSSTTGKQPSNVQVTISPASAQVVAGKAFDFAATVTGSSNPEVSWKVEEGEEGGRVVSRGAKASGGQVSMMVVYIAPDTPGTYHLIASSKAEPQKSAAAEITVTPR